jgi:C1A family cysteine protease
MNKRVYGWKPDRPDFRDLVFEKSKVTAPPLPDLDLRSVQPPIFDQGQLGSCTGNGISAELEAQALSQGLPFQAISRLFIYYNERDIEGTVDSDSGANIRDGIKSVNTTGACAESEWAYDISKFTVKPPPQCYTDALNFTASKYESVNQTLNDLQSALSSGRGLVIGISVYDSFESEETANTGIVSIPAASESQVGGHCVRLVGYTNNGINGIPAKHFIGANSWGVDWGLKGYFAIPYEYILNPGLASDFWLIQAIAGTTILHPKKNIIHTLVDDIKHLRF